jgi:hypothetical protein
MGVHDSPHDFDVLLWHWEARNLLTEYCFHAKQRSCPGYCFSSKQRSLLRQPGLAWAYRLAKE